MSNYLAAYSLSISDLVLDKEFVKAYGENDVPKIKQILWKYGMDTVNKEFEEVFCTHRNLQNQVHTCTRYNGAERTDKIWINGEYSSMYAKIEASGRGAAFKGDLISMLHQGSSVSTQSWEEEDLYSNEKERRLNVK